VSDMKKIMTVASTMALVCVVGASAGTITMDLGSATGGMAMHYNGPPEDPQGGANLAYMKTQDSANNPNGALFTFDTTDLGYIDPVLAGLNMSVIFGGGVRFGFDLVVPFFPTVPGSVPGLWAVDNGGTAVGNVGQMVWAVNDYKSGGPGNPAAVPVNSLFRSLDGNVNNSMTLDTLNSTGLGGGNWQVDIAGTLISDSFVHWFDPGTDDMDLSSLLGLNPVIAFSGSLVYDRSNDTTPGMDFYAGTIGFKLTVDDPRGVPVPDAGSTLALLSLASFGLAAFRRRFVC